MSSYITEQYDFHDAITAPWNLKSNKYKDFNIIKVNPISDNVSIVNTSHGEYWCESVEFENRIFMKVAKLV